MDQLEILYRLKSLLENLLTIQKSLRMSPDTKIDIRNTVTGGPTGPAKIAGREGERGRNVAVPPIV